MDAPGPTVIVCHAGALTPDPGSIELLALLRLAARRSGARFEVRAASSELCDLLAFLGLSQVLGVEPQRQAEEREQGGGVEEEDDLADPSP